MPDFAERCAVKMAGLYSELDQISVSACLLPLPRNVMELTLTVGKVAARAEGDGVSVGLLAG